MCVLYNIYRLSHGCKAKCTRSAYTAGIILVCNIHNVKAAIESRVSQCSNPTVEVTCTWSKPPYKIITDYKIIGS